MSESLAALSVAELMLRAYRAHVLVPAFNVAHLPMVQPIVETVQRLGSFALLEVARPDIEHFGAMGYAAVQDEYRQQASLAHLRLHQDHVPVIDEEQRAVDWPPLIEEALSLGYHSVMVDGSRLPFEENAAVTRRVVEMAHPGVAVEAELGAVFGHEPGPLPPYEELFRTGRGFTDVDEAARFVQETGVDWLSVAAGNIHGAISGAARDTQKPQARLHVEHLGHLAAAVQRPLVLHGGSGIELSCLLEAVQAGITKVNVGTAVRQPYEAALREGQSVAEAQTAVARVTEEHLNDYRAVGSAGMLTDQ